MNETVPDLYGRDHDRCECGHERQDHRRRQYHGRSECDRTECGCLQFTPRVERSVLDNRRETR